MNDPVAHTRSNQPSSDWLTKFAVGGNIRYCRNAKVLTTKMGDKMWAANRLRHAPVEAAIIFIGDSSLIGNQ